MHAKFFLIYCPLDGIPSVLPVHEGISVVGRSSQNDICLPDSTVSREHARLFVIDGTVAVEDLKSHNGTFVNDTKITGCCLVPGQRIRFGSVEFRLSIEPSADVDPNSNQDTVSARARSRFLASMHTLDTPLSPAQERVFLLLASCRSEKQIAADLGLSNHTVHNHVREIYRAYDVHTRAEFVLKVLKIENQRKHNKNSDGGARAITVPITTRAPSRNNGAT